MGRYSVGNTYLVSSMSATGDRSVTVTFAGSGDAFGSGGRLLACIVVQAGEQPPILVDCGATSWLRSNAKVSTPTRLPPCWFRIYTWIITAAFRS